MKKVANSKVNGTDQKIDAIKDILFGQQMTEYNKQFEELRTLVAKSEARTEKSLDKFKSQILSTIENLEGSLNTGQENLERKLDKEIDRLAEGKADKKTLGKLLIGIGEKLTG